MQVRRVNPTAEYNKRAAIFRLPPASRGRQPSVAVVSSGFPPIRRRTPESRQLTLLSGTRVGLRYTAHVIGFPVKKLSTGPLCGFVIGLCAVASGQSRPTSSITSPRTPWGDPDLQGIWSGVAMSEVPLQRPPQFGSRSTLTDQEFLARVAQAEKQREDDENGPVDPATPSPQHWIERGRPSRQASLIIDPADGRLPPLTA